MEHFDAVVVGSGFGASVAAYRLADAGQAVCVLERGRRYPPGSFPTDPRGLADNLWDPRQGLHGLFDMWSFRGIESLVSSGLGGGSLIYANVLLRKDEHWFVNEPIPGGGYERWPIDRALLDPHYDAVLRMMDVQSYPFALAPYDKTPKTNAMRDAAQALGYEWMLPDLAVSFASKGEAPVPGMALHEDRRNLHDRDRTTCRLCGECDTGCNYGSKNTLDYTYLSRAKDHGAQIHTLSEVVSVVPMDGPGGGPNGYRVTYVTHDADTAQPVPYVDLPTTTVTAKRVVLGAGTFGSTYLMLKNRSAFPRIGPALGTRFSGNGDLLTFLSAADRPLDPAVGPVITSAIRMPDGNDGGGAKGRGFYVEDGGNPSYLSWVAETAGAPQAAARVASFLAKRVWAHVRGNPRSNISADLAKMLGGGRRSSSALPILAMGRDVPNGVMRLRDGDLDLDWTARASNAYFERVEDTVHRIAAVLGAKLVNTPLWLFKRVITVHPLGGCPMAVNDRDGVIGSDGHVFHYPGLYVVDGASMPGPVGPNPSLTIAAFADHVADGMLGGDGG